jgi:hypothetical protein
VEEKEDKKVGGLWKDEVLKLMRFWVKGVDGRGKRNGWDGKGKG